MRSYRLRLDEYGISRARYDELKAFCRQYDDKKAHANDLLYKTMGKLTGMPRGNNASDPARNNSIRRDGLIKDCEMIEQAAIEANAELYPYIMDNVTRDVQLWKLKPPCGKNQFYKARRKFFFCLHENETKSRGSWGNRNVL